MLTWLAVAVLVALAGGVVLHPLLSTRHRIEGGSASDVYVDQIAEIDADRQRGVIGEEEAAAARTEIARRLLRAKADEAPVERTASRRSWAVVTGVFLAAFTLGAYAFLGMPQMPDQPLAARVAPTSEGIASMIEAAEEQLAASPGDAEGWAAIAPAYQQVGRFEDAARAFRRARELSGPSAALFVGEAESLTLANRGRVTGRAESLFEAARTLDPDLETPAIFLAIAARQNGNLKLAAERWDAILQSSDGSEPWLPIANAEMARLAETDAGLPVGERPALTGPTVDQAAAAQEMSPQARETIIRGMVARLDARLSANGGSAEEWVQLVRSYQVLGDEDGAADALSRAEAALSDAAIETLRQQLDANQ